MLDHDRERSVAVAAQPGGAVADGIPVDRVGDEVEIGQVVHGDGPEGIDRRVLIKRDGVPVASVQLVAVGVGVGHRVGRLVAVVAPQAGPGGQGPGQVAGVAIGDLPRRVIDRARAQVVEVVVEHVVGERPAVDDRRQAACRERRVHLLLRGVRARRQRLGQAGRAVGVRSGRAEQAERGEPLLVGAVRPGWGKGLHPGPHLLEEGQLGGDGGRCREADRGRGGAVRLQGQPALQGLDGIQVSQAVAGPAADDRGHVRRELDHPGSVRRIRLPSRRDQQEGPGRGTGRPAAHVCEVIGPRVDELQHVIAPGRVRHAQQHGAAAHVDLRDGVDGVVVDRHEPVLRPGQLGRVAEAVEGSCRKRPHAFSSEAAYRLQVEDQRKAVDVGISGKRRTIITHPGPPSRDASHGDLAEARPKGPAQPCPPSDAPELQLRWGATHTYHPPRVRCCVHFDTSSRMGPSARVAGAAVAAQLPGPTSARTGLLRPAGLGRPPSPSSAGSVRASACVSRLAPVQRLISALS